MQAPGLTLDRGGAAVRYVNGASRRKSLLLWEDVAKMSKCHLVPLIHDFVAPFRATPSSTFVASAVCHDNSLSVPVGTSGRTHWLRFSEERWSHCVSTDGGEEVGESETLVPLLTGAASAP